MINTTPGAVLETMDVNGTEITINAPTPGFTFLIQDVEVNLGGLLEIRGDFRVAGGSFSGTGLEIFVGKGPSTDPNAIGILITNATIEYRKVGAAGRGLYALYATGTVTLLGLPGLTVTRHRDLHAQHERDHGEHPHGRDDVDQHRRQHVLARPHRPRARSRRHAEDRGHRERHAPPDRRPRRLDPGGHDRHHRRRHRAVQRSAAARSSRSTRRRASSSRASRSPASRSAATPTTRRRATTPRSRCRRPPTSCAPASASRPRSVGKFIDIVFTDRSGDGIRVESIIDAGPGVRADGQRRRDRGRLRHAGGRRGQAGHVPLRRSPSIPPLGPRAGPLPAGLVLGQLGHRARHQREPHRGRAVRDHRRAATSSARSPRLTSPANGEQMTALDFNARRSIDVTYRSLDGTALDIQSITDTPPFKLTGTGLADVELDSLGRPIIAGYQVIGGLRADAPTITIRYYLKDKNTKNRPTCSRPARSTSSSSTALNGFKTTGQRHQPRRPALDLHAVADGARRGGRDQADHARPAHAAEPDDRHRRRRLQPDGLLVLTIAHRRRARDAGLRRRQPRRLPPASQSTHAASAST